ncbi:hypothetical protein IAQ61_000350 [Plenodomus lingam]|nr:hypothetical protein IAQ61_000350 [Plenodomus lingam]
MYMTYKRTLILALATLTTAQTSTTNEPCAVVASSLSLSSSSVPAQAAYDCLESVPVDVEGDSQLIDELKIVWQFQSELGWYKNPGEDWPYGPLDVEGELDKIKNSLSSFSSEYAVQLAIQNITVRSGNFHWNHRPDILRVFTFRRQFRIASVSSDGKALPKLYIYEDVEALAEGSPDVSEISEINGQKPYDYLRSIFYSQFIDYDGKMNYMLTKGDTSQEGAFTVQPKFEGNSTDITWANGTTASAINFATTEHTSEFSNVTDGTSFFETFCTGAVSGVQTLEGNAKTAVIPPARLGPIPNTPTGTYHRRNKRQSIPNNTPYPSAVVEISTGGLSGYFLTGNGYEDIAVLKILLFYDPQSRNETEFNHEFQAAIKSFISQCISENKKKLIIDLRENGGGATNLLIDTFMQLFPTLDPFSGQRYRANDAWNKIGSAVDEVYSSPDFAKEYQDPAGEAMENSNVFRFWSWWQFRTAEGENFNSWDQFNGPLDLNSDKLTATMRYNYSDSNQVSIRPEGFDFVTGDRPSPFNASNVVMFTDALCGSSCASFHEELKNIAGVKAVTVGGLPENKPIQTVTGSKGGEVIPLFNFPLFAMVTLDMTSQLNLSSIEEDDDSLFALANAEQVKTRVGDSLSRIQSQDQIRKGDKTATPLQFIYEAADCRIFYTAETFADPDAAWKQAWDAFQDDSKCVEGSTGHKSSISGGYKPYGAGPLKAEDQPAKLPTGYGNGNGNKSGGGGGKNSGASVNVKASTALFAIAAVALVMIMM